ncbi:hypothetical protein E4198_16295 [Streptomyces sp. RKND-216]|uniref:isocitrate lyase/phosphoenolpyruvate mutase family protein n=1 Tax=Streptomyces sp. RKND-216 TaxID=2562581 RepID=UPI00109DD9D4|nr:isocitrate lyase/phosphoenolpyruvate mutase family protein [Streptomyces sp. RKND-216]THA26051.1 hypothetical protein E4198_16295 [Streptomyces sp. RKND-216]
MPQPPPEPVRSPSPAPGGREWRRDPFHGVQHDVGGDLLTVGAAEDAVVALAERFGPGRLSLLGTPGAPSPERLAELGVARVSYGPFPHRRVLGALAEEAAALLGGDDGAGATGG